ncbi:MAG: hypothetical protein R3C53_02205 [Pirellulaceae bacterium]
MFRNTSSILGLALLANVLLRCSDLIVPTCLAQDASDGATVSSSIGGDGSGSIIIEARGQVPAPPTFFTASAKASAQVTDARIEQTVQLSARVIQGKSRRLSFGLNGEGDVRAVQGEKLSAWSIRQTGAERFLDLYLSEDSSSLQVEISMESPQFQLAQPVEINLLHLTPGEAVGFDSVVNIQYDSKVIGIVTSVNGFAPLASGHQANGFQTTTGGEIKLKLSRSGGVVAPVELVEASLRGTLHSNGKSMEFQLRGTARVDKPNAELVVLFGKAAISQLPSDENYKLRLSMEGDQPVYKLVFPKSGEFPVTLNLVANLDSPEGQTKAINFTVAASAVVPLTLEGLDAELEFQHDQDSVVPLREQQQWLGFLPATGRAKLQWKPSRKANEGKLFFTTTGRIEASIGAGLLRQEHQLDYQVLQGELKSISMLLHGPGEILDVQGEYVIGWNVATQGDNRQLDIALSQPISGTSQFQIRSQTPLGAFPLRIEGLRLNPMGAMRHSGYIRISNVGSVRLEPTNLSGMTQLAPDQFPGEPSEARQVFVYRFPATEHEFTVAADRIQPEVNISELVLYELTESDRVIRADIELDIREAPIREWDFDIPSDYSVVAVAGANISDYVVASEAFSGRRNLRVIFAQDVAGRQLVSLHLEKNEVVAAGEWALPRLAYPGAKAVRGDIGVLGTPGIRISIGTTDLLVEKPVSYFPKPTATLQQAFRIREPGWSATMQVELLERSAHADVFHLYSLSEETVYGSALINYFVAGAPISEWQIHVPAALGNVTLDGQGIRTWRREGDTVFVALHQPVLGPYTLLVTFEEKPDVDDRSFTAGQVAPIDVQGERGYIQVVSATQAELETVSISPDMLKLDALELPAEFRLLSAAAPQGTWQYTKRPFDLNLRVKWYSPGTTVAQVVEFSEANSRVSKDGELVTDVIYFVKSRGQRALKVQLPSEPVRLWEVSVDGRPVTARQSDDALLIPLPGGIDPNLPVEVRLRMGKPTVDDRFTKLALPTVFAPVLKTQWNVSGDEQHVLVPNGGNVSPPEPVLRPSGLDWVANRAVLQLVLICLFTSIGVWGCRKTGFLRLLGLLALTIAIGVSLSTVSDSYARTGPTVPLQLSLPVLSSGETVELQVVNVPLWRVKLSWQGLLLCGLGLVGVGLSFTSLKRRFNPAMRAAGILLIAVGLLLQGDGAPLFFLLLSLAILILLLFRPPWTGSEVFQTGSEHSLPIVKPRRKTRRRQQTRPIPAQNLALPRRRSYSSHSC